MFLIEVLPMREVSPRPTNRVTPDGPVLFYGVRHTKFAASSILPEPVYPATCG